MSRPDWPHDENCLFCKIVGGSIPSAKIYEDEHVYAFMDINPVNKGHCLVIPKGHWANLLEMPDDLCGPVLSAVKRVADGVMGATGAEGFNCLQNNHAVAGQVIFHAHWHILPRYSDDGLTLWVGRKCDNLDELQQLAVSIKARITQGEEPNE